MLRVEAAEVRNEAAMGLGAVVWVERRRVWVLEAGDARLSN